MIINNQVPRLLNTIFTPVSGSHTLHVTYSLRWSYPSNLSNNLSGVAYLESREDKPDAQWETISQVELGLKLSLGITLGLELSTTSVLSGFIKPLSTIRIRTEGVIPMLVQAQEVVID